MQALNSNILSPDAAVCSPDGTNPCSDTTRCLPVHRRVDIDVLHVLICVSVFIAHVLLIFSPHPYYHLKNAAPSQSVGVLYEFIRTCSMTLFFLLAGRSSLTSLRSRGAGRFLRERCLRLLVPLVAGMLFLCPVIKYVELLNGRDLRPSGMLLVAPTHLSFMQFLPKFYLHLNQTTWSHLWFLAYLLVYCLIFVPVLVKLARLDWQTSIPLLPEALAYLPVLPLALLLVSVQGWWPFYPNLWKDLGNFSYFGLYFLIGAVMATCPAFERCVHRNWLPLGLCGAAGFAGLVCNVETSIGRLFVAVAAWGCTGAILGLAARFQPAENMAIRYLRDATLPFYMLHHVAVLVIGWYVLQLNVGPALKIAVLLPAAVLGTMLIYEGLVRRQPVLRFLFGMRPLSAGSQRHRG
jgi:glucan biosynthesis protein C